MRIRPTARLLVIDERQRFLLFNYEDIVPLDPGHPDLINYWVTPGGGVEAGETYEQAAVRELWEETGIQAPAVGPCVWTRELTLFFSGSKVRFCERYYWMPVMTNQVVLTQLNEQEQQVYRGHCWWSLAEMEQSREIFFPPGLPRLLKPLLAGNIPPEPVTLEA